MRRTAASVRVNMAAGGIYTIGGAFWEFGQPDWDRTKLFVMFGVAEDHDSNPIKIGIGKLKARGARVISVNPIRTGYSAVADDWIGITPGTDGLLILSLIHCLLEAGKIDLDYLAQWTNAPLLVNEAEGPEKGLFVRNAESQPFVIDSRSGHPAPWDGKGVQPDLGAEWQGNRTVFRHMVEEYLKPDYAPEAVAARCGVTALRIRQLAAELAEVAFDQAITLDRPWTDFRGNEHENMPGRPVSFHAMRGISAHSNGFQTARALHLLQIILGSLETPGGYRLKPPYPKPIEAHPTPHFVTTPGKPLTGPHLGYVRSPDDLALLPDGSPARIDKAFSWENPVLGPRADAHADPERPCGRPLPDRHAVPLHGQHGVEFLDELRPRDGDADREGRGRRISDPPDHLFRRLCQRDGGLCRPDPARHDLSGTARLHQPARPPDHRSPMRRGRDPLAGGGAGPRGALLPVGPPRPWRKAGPAGDGERGWQPRNSRTTPTTS